MRADAVVVRDGRLLLVRNRGSTRYSVPGGGVPLNGHVHGIVKELRKDK